MELFIRLGILFVCAFIYAVTKYYYHHTGKHYYVCMAILLGISIIITLAFCVRTEWLQQWG